MKLKTLAQGLVLAGLASHALAQETQRVEITGSSIKRIQTEGALPVQTIRRAEIEREGIVSTEQLVMQLTSNGTGLDNLASNADVVSGAARGNNGASSANLRGQGSGATLILLNGRRVAAHGLNGGTVDLNQIPLAAIDRVEILKDGASAIYGTDAIGGVINFILRNSYRGLSVQGFVDVPEAKGGAIYRGSLVGGFGDLDKDGFNVLATLTRRENKVLRGDQRSFVNTFQPERGLSPDTRGTPNGTIFPMAGTIIPAAGSAPFIPGTTTRASGGINVLDLPGGPGCNSIDGMGAYDHLLWATPSAQYACAWDTGRAAVIQQPVESTSLVTRGVFKLGQHTLSAELVASQVDTAKRFSHIQLFPSTGLTPLRYPRNADSAAVYDDIFNRLVATFPTLEPVRGQPIAYRFRCIECGPREIKTTADTSRYFIGIDGPLLGWDYRAGLSHATSEVQSELGKGYVYRRTNAAAGVTGIVEVLNTGVVNPFLLPGQVQSQAALDLIASTSAEGVVLYGGKYSVTQADFSTSGPVFKLPGGDALAAVGVDVRQEKYRFNGDQRAAAARPEIIGAPFDDGNALAGVKRDIKAVYAELLLPITKSLETTLAVRRDDYTGFGTTTNPKVSLAYRPSGAWLVRASYNTGFRVPSFNQLFNGRIEQQFLGADLADPATCPGGVPNPAVAGCAAVQPLTLAGGKPDLNPETAKGMSVGFVWQPLPNFSVSADWWRVERENTFRILSIRDLVNNYALFTDRFLRASDGTLLAIDQRWVNAGGNLTDALEISLRGSSKGVSGTWTAGMDITYLLEKKSRLLPNIPYGASEVGQFSFSGDLGLRWKHNAFVTYSQGNWGATLSQLYRSGYRDQVLPGVANGTVRPPLWNPKVREYMTFNGSLTYSGVKNLTLTAGIKNLFDEDPPFAISYDSNTGAGSSWEPRVADPRGRSYTLLAEYKFF